MRIAFICCGLEPGRDGVGDYVRRLAGALLCLGHEASIVALNDPFVTKVIDEPQLTEGHSVPTLRLPRVQSWATRERQSCLWINEFCPDYTSLHYVAFGFHPKGLPWRLEQRLNRILGSTRKHIMLHELWLLANWQESPKRYLWGSTQRILLQRLLRKLNPAIITTSHERYQSLLATHGYAATTQRIFSAIPIVAPTGWFSSYIHESGITSAQRERWVLLGIFGSIHAAWSVDGWLSYLVDRAALQGKRVAFFGMGRLSTEGEERFSAIQASVGSKVILQHLGEHSPEHVSEFFQSIDIGVSTMDRTLLDKSSSAAAMIEHRVPLLVTRIDDRKDRTVASLEVRCEIDRLLEDTGLSRNFPKSSGVLQERAAEFITLLETDHRGGVCHHNALKK